MQDQRSNHSQEASSEKRKYSPPALQRYETPTLQKHQSYKEITLAPSVVLSPPPGPPGPPPQPGSTTLSEDIFPGTETE